MCSGVKNTDVVQAIDLGQDQELLNEIYHHELPPVLNELVEEYQGLENARPPFMWKWVHKLAPYNTLPCVDPKYTGEIPIDKTLTILFITLLDDILEKQRDRATFEEISNIPFEHRSVRKDREDVDSDYTRFAERVWETLVERIQRGPEYEAYEELFLYDIKQAINAIEYSDLVIRCPDLATMRDLEAYESHNMVMFAYADIDLMHSPVDMRDELPRLRKAIGVAQQMTRIGNWLSTWERELQEGDYSSGVVVYALENGIISLSDLREIEPGRGEKYNRIVKRIKDHDVEEVFLTRWNDYYNEMHRINDEITQVDLTPFIEGLEEVLRYHFASTGLK
ncbi:MAG: hypothetical protein SV377_02395 [Halobacteria archaeon]|nr:hypothetical protein [Halobacteria archaeon]